MGCAPPRLPAATLARVSEPGDPPRPLNSPHPRQRGRARRGLGLGSIATRQLRSRATLTLAQAAILAAAVTLVASVVLIQDISTDNGLRSAIVQAAAAQGGDVVIERDGIAGSVAADAFQADAATRVRAQLGRAVSPAAQYDRTGAEVLRTIDGVQQGQPFSNVSSVTYYAGLSDHVRVVAGSWPADAPVGSDWPITVSARATDTLGTPLHFHVGSEYCFSPALSRGPAGRAWCGRVAATWLPLDANDAYWAGHVPETDILVGHDSFFQVSGQYPGAVESAVQQYAPDASDVTAANASAVVAGVAALRGYYSVSSNDVFISGLDAAITAFLARQAAAAGPLDVTTFGLLVVALGAMGFAAVQFMDGHASELALWRARGWPRSRVWGLHTIEFAALAVVATPLAIVASAAIGTAVAGSGSSLTFGWSALGRAAVPAVIAAAAFLVILAGLAAVRSAPGMSRRPSAGTSAQRGWRRRAVDVVLAAAGVGILVLVRLGGADPSGDGQATGVLLALPVLGVALLAVASLRLVGVTARLLGVSRSLAARLARWQVERDPAQYARLCLLVTLAVAVGVFASTYTASDRASALERADYAVGADMRATFSSANSPPRLTALTASLPAGTRAAQVFRSAGRPGRSGTDATVLGIQGTDFWSIANSRADFAAQPLATLTGAMAAADPDGAAVPGIARALALTVYSSGLDASVGVEITDATGHDVTLAMGSLSAIGWSDRSVSLATAGPLTSPLHVRALRLTITGANAVGDVAVEGLRTDGGAVIESFARGDGWWQESFAPDTTEAALTPTRQRSRGGEASADIPVNLSSILLLPPPSSRPLPVLLASQTMASLGVGLGEPFPLHMDTVNVELVAVGSFDDFPTHYPQLEDLVVAPMDSLLGRLGNQGATSPWPNELWLSFPSRLTTAVSARVSVDSTLLTSALRSDAENAAVNDPLRVGLHDELGLGFIVALAVVVIGFGLHFLAAARNRVTQFAIMRANGVPRATLRRTLVLEQVVVLVTGLVAGTLIGLLLSWAAVPVFHLGTLPADVTPPSVFAVDVTTLVAVLLGSGAASLLIGGAVANTGSRVDVMSTVRSLA